MNIFITILGSGAALPTGRRHCAAQLLNIGGFKMLLDCAEGTQDRIRQNHIKLQSISTIVISHLHGDHFFGLAGLLSTMHLCGRTEPMTVVAPLGAREVIETTFRLTGNHIGFDIEWVEMDFSEGCRRVFENKRCTVEAFPIVHSVPTYGFRITSEVGLRKPELDGATANPELRTLTYVYCCDTVYTEAMLPYIADADLLCLECTFANELAELAETRFHLTAGQAGRLARMAGAKQLLLSHISARYKEPEILLQQAGEEFENSLLAADGMRIELLRNGNRVTMQHAE